MKEVCPQNTPALFVRNNPVMSATLADFLHRIPRPAERCSAWAFAALARSLPNHAHTWVAGRRHCDILSQQAAKLSHRKVRRHTLSRNGETTIDS